MNTQDAPSQPGGGRKGPAAAPTRAVRGGEYPESSPPEGWAGRLGAERPVESEGRSGGDGTESRNEAAERHRRLRGGRGQGARRADRPALRGPALRGDRRRRDAAGPGGRLRRRHAARASATPTRRSGSSSCAPRRARARSRSARPSSRSRAPSRCPPRTERRRARFEHRAHRVGPGERRRREHRDVVGDGGGGRPRPGLRRVVVGGPHLFRPPAQPLGAPPCCSRRRAPRSSATSGSTPTCCRWRCSGRRWRARRLRR